jgi:hypothetical protein
MDYYFDGMVNYLDPCREPTENVGNAGIFQRSYFFIRSAKTRFQ